MFFLLKTETSKKACLLEHLDQRFCSAYEQRIQEWRKKTKAFSVTGDKGREKAPKRNNKNPYSFSLKSLEDQLSLSLCVLWMDRFELIGDRVGLA